MLSTAMSIASRRGSNITCVRERQVIDALPEGFDRCRFRTGYSAGCLHRIGLFAFERERSLASGAVCDILLQCWEVRGVVGKNETWSGAYA